MLQTAKQHMIYLNAVMDSFRYSRGPQLGEDLVGCDFVETLQKIYRRHFSNELFHAEEADQILFYNLLVSLQVRQYICDGQV